MSYCLPYHIFHIYKIWCYFIYKMTSYWIAYDVIPYIWYHMPYHKHTVTNEISVMEKRNQQAFGHTFMHESCWCRRLVSCYWDTAAGGSEKTSRAPVLKASVHLVTAEPHLLHDCKKVTAVFLRAYRVPANTPHPGLFTSKHTFCHCHQLSVSFSAVFILCS